MEPLYEQPGCAYTGGMKKILLAALLLASCTSQPSGISLEGKVTVPSFVDDTTNTSGWVMTLTDSTGLKGVSNLGSVDNTQFHVYVSPQGLTSQEYLLTTRLSKNNATLLGRLVTLEANQTNLELTPLSSLTALARYSALALGDSKVLGKTNAQLEAAIPVSTQSRFETALGEFILGIRHTAPMDDPTYIQEFYAQLRARIESQPSE